MPRKLSLQFRTRTLFALTAGAAAGLALWTAYVVPYRAQQRAIAAVTQLGGTVRTEQSGPVLLRALVGDRYFRTVVEVDLSGTAVRDADLAALRSLRNLRLLQLSATQVGDAGLEHISGLSGLKELRLDRTQVTDAGLAHLSRLSELRWLLLSSTRIRDAGLAHLNALSNLELLDLHKTMVTVAATAELCETLPKLEVVVGSGRIDRS